MAKSKYKYRAVIVIPSQYQEAANARWKQHMDPTGGDQTFTVGLSNDGSPPAQAYVADTPLRAEHRDEIKWLADNAPRAWIAIFCRPNLEGSIAWLEETFDKPEYKQTNWQYRSKAYVSIQTQPRSLEWLLAKMAEISSPTVNLQTISGD